MAGYPCCCAPTIEVVSCEECNDDEAPAILQVTLPRLWLRALDAGIGGTVISELDLPAGDYLLENYTVRSGFANGLNGCFWYGPVMYCDGTPSPQGSFRVEGFWRPCALLRLSPFSQFLVGWASWTNIEADPDVTTFPERMATIVGTALAPVSTCFDFSVSGTATQIGDTGGLDGLGTNSQLSNWCGVDGSFTRNIRYSGTVNVQSL